MTQFDQGSAAWQQGLYSDHMIQSLIDDKVIYSEEPNWQAHIQPASLDLSLGECAYRIRASFLPGKNSSVAEKLSQYEIHRFSLKDGAVLEKGCVYLVPLQEKLSLPDKMEAVANPKSSTGRLDIFTRVICDQGNQFDHMPAGYHGPLYAEISPRTFSVLVRQGTRLTQLRLQNELARLSDTALQVLHKQTPLVQNSVDPVIFQNGLAVRVDLAGTWAKDVAATGDRLVGWRARQHTGLIDLEKIASYPISEFWDPIYVGKSQQIILDPEAFYILASRENICIPPGYAAEMVASDPAMGEFRVHYAGFFDPGFGMVAKGARAVLEVRSRDVPFVLEDGQIVAKLQYDPLLSPSTKNYGQEIGSHYQAQGLALAKQFTADLSDLA